MVLAAVMLVAMAGAAQEGQPWERDGTVAVFPLAAEVGVSDGTAKLVSEQLVHEVRGSNAFKRVVSLRDIEAVLGYDRQKQLLDCSSESCVAEVSGALGVEYLLVGNVGRLGASYVFTIRLLKTTNGTSLGSVSLRRAGGSDEVLLDAVTPAVMQLLTQAGLATAPVITPEAQQSGGSSTLPLAAGAVGLAAGAVGVVAGLAVLGAGVLAVVVPILTYVPTPFLDGNQRQVFFPALSVGAAVVALVGGVVSVALLAAGGFGIARGMTGGGE